MISEGKLDRAFAEKIENDRDFSIWLLKQTKFSEYAENLILLNKEQARIKPKKKPENWWRHWWCELEDGTQSETDIFLVYEFPKTAKRIAIHIENKPPHGVFRKEQPENYKPRAVFMSGKIEYMNYDDFCTIILAPKDFLANNKDMINHFDETISYESFQNNIELFSKSLSESKNA